EKSAWYIPAFIAKRSSLFRTLSQDASRSRRRNGAPDSSRMKTLRFSDRVSTRTTTKSVARAPRHATRSAARSIALSVAFIPSRRSGRPLLPADGPELPQVFVEPSVRRNPGHHDEHPQGKKDPHIGFAEMDRHQQPQRDRHERPERGGDVPEGPVQLRGRAALRASMPAERARDITAPGQRELRSTMRAGHGQRGSTWTALAIAAS